MYKRQPDSIWAKTEFPENVYIFSSPELDCFRFDDIGVNVYGYAFTESHMDKCPFSDPPALDKDKINLLCAHGDLLDTDSRYCPCLLYTSRGAIQIVSTPKSMGIPKIAIAFTTIPLLMAIISAAPVLFVEKRNSV